MIHERILGRMLNVPLAINETKLLVLQNQVIPLLIMGQKLETGVAEPTQKSYMPVESKKLAVVNVFDSLVAKGGAGESGYTSYQGLQNKIESAISNGATDICLYADSPGGEFSGLLAFTSYLTTLPSRGIRTFTYTDGLMCSAMYAIACATQKVYGAESSVSGSIGVLMVHLDRSTADEKAGLKFTIFRSKELKAIGDSHSPLSEDALASITQNLASADAMFNNEVVQNRPNLSLQNVMDMKGASFSGPEALRLGLLDAIVPNLGEALSLGTKRSLNQKRGTTMTVEEIDALKAQLQSANEKVGALTHELAVAKSASGLAATEATAAERTRCLTILGSAKTLGHDLSAATAHIEKGYTTEVSLEIFTGITEARQAANSINTQQMTGNADELDGPATGASKAELLLKSYMKATGIKTAA